MRDRSTDGGAEVRRRPSGKHPIYLGVDVAGASNTWVAALSPGVGGGLAVVHRPRLASLAEIVGYCEDNDVVAAAIDAQLTIAISDESGYRDSDRRLIRELPEDCQNWVMSFNSLMAVPVRGRLLAEHLSPVVATLLETHPRASLLFGLGNAENEIHEAVREYKRKRGDTREQTEARAGHTRGLWRCWSDRFGIAHNGAVEHDGALDSLVCATVAHLFHHEPSALRRLCHAIQGRVGRGPFYVLAPGATPDADDRG